MTAGRRTRAANGRAPGTPRSGPLARVRSSLLLKILGGLVVALVGSSALTAFLETRLTNDSLAKQSRRLTASDLRVLSQAYTERERTLTGVLRNLGQSLGEELAQGDRNALIKVLGANFRNLELDLLQVVGADGRPLEGPEPRVGLALARPPSVTSLDRRTPSSRLLPTADGRWVQVVLLPIGTAADAPVLVGGYEFGDGFAYRLRGALGELGHVVLVARGDVVGSTLVDSPAEPPGRRPDGSLPTSPVAEEVGGVDTLVAYRTVNGSADGVPGALGVSLADPAALLDRALNETHLMAVAVLATLALLVGWLFFRALVRPLVVLKETAGRIAGGDLEASFEATGSDEIAALATSLERMRLELRAQLGLIARQAGALQHSSQRIAAAQDEERHRLARDLHDGIQQQLVVLRMGFGLVKESADRVPGPLSRSLEELSAELDAVIERLREVSHDLYPSILVDRGLGVALRSCVARLPLSARLVCSPEPLPRLPPEIESGAYFLVGEALAKALKHADASEITIALEVGPQWLRVAVRDDGRGFDPGASPRRGGLLHMEDRARSFGGELRIRSEPGGGTEIVATFPLRASLDVVPTA